MTEQEVNQQIARKVQAFNDQIFPEPLPDWLLDNFEKLIMETPQKDVRYFADTVRKILAKKPNELTIYEAGFVMDVWNGVKPKLVAKNITQFLDRKGILGNAMQRYNTFLAKENAGFEREKAALMRLVTTKKKILTSV